MRRSLTPRLIFFHGPGSEQFHDAGQQLEALLLA